MSDTFWLNYLFFTDFSDEKDTLVEIPKGVLNADNTTLLAAVLSTHDQGEGRPLWTDKEGVKWSLVGVEVIYNGPNNTGLPTNGLYDHTLILKFPTTSQAPTGTIALNYNTAPKTVTTVPDAPASSGSETSADTTPTADATAS